MTFAPVAPALSEKRMTAELDGGRKSTLHIRVVVPTQPEPRSYAGEPKRIAS